MDFEGNPPPFIADKIRAILYEEFEKKLIEKNYKEDYNDYKRFKIFESKKFRGQREEYYLSNYNKRLEEYLSSHQISDREVEELQQKLYDNQDFIEE